MTVATVKETQKLVAEVEIICPHCGSQAKRQSNSVLYQGEEFGTGLAYICSNYPQCDSYVSCHPDGTARGTLANKELRKWRGQAHRVFDPLWKSGVRTRSSAYQWLAEKMELDIALTHIAMFDVKQCQRVIALCDEFRSDVPMKPKTLDAKGWQELGRIHKEEGIKAMYKGVRPYIEAYNAANTPVAAIFEELERW